MSTKHVLRWAAFAAIYFALQAIPTALYGDNPALRGANAMAVFLLLLTPRRQWLFLAPMFWLAAGAARELTQAPQPWMVGACNALEVLCMAAILHGRRGLGDSWYGRDQLSRLLLAACGVPLLSGAVAAAALHSAAGVAFRAQWFTWALASALAYVSLMPLLLSWTRRTPPGEEPAQPLARRIAGIVLIAVACVIVVRQEVYPPLLLLSFPLLVLCTWWYRLAGATSLMAVLAITGGWFAARDVGALFHILEPGAAMPARVQVLQLYLAATVLCTLPFAVLLAEQENLWSQLRRKSDARAEFLAAMSHEIRTPMTGVLGMADLLAAQELSAEQRRYVDAMRSSGRHLVNVINDILDFSRIETGKLTIESVDFRVSEMVEQVRSLVHPAALEKNLSFDVRLPPGAQDVVQGDPTRLRQILLNLAGNAVKFTAKGSVSLDVSVDADPSGHSLYRFQVRDTGIGIPLDKVDGLFTPFSQADRSTAREYGGSGLGLAISSRLAEAMGGRIEVESRAGHGSLFTLAVPLAPGNPEHRAAGSSDALADAPPQRILVAEDVQINRDILERALGARGHRVSFAHDGAAALARVQQESFDMVLMDVQMPVMDGVEATRRIRALPGEVGRIPIIGLTANVMHQEQARYLGAGMDECLMKPIEWDRLAAAIARHASEGGREPAARDAAWEEAARAPVAADVPLLEERQIASLRELGSEAEFVQMMHNIMESVQRMLDEIVAAVEAVPMAAAAHRLKGSAGMGGLARVSALAGSLEEACVNGHDVRDFQRQLAESVQETRAALVGAGRLKA